MKNTLNRISKKYSQYVNGDHSLFIRVLGCGDFIAFKTINDDWCIINTKMDIREGMYIVNTEPFTNTTVIYVLLSDFDSLFPELQEIPETIKWPLHQHNDSRSN